MSDGDAELGAGVGAEVGAEEGDCVGAGGDGCHRWPPGSGVQLTRTACGAEAGGSNEMVALPPPAPRVISTLSVTLCPARSVPV